MKVTIWLAVMAAFFVLILGMIAAAPAADGLTTVSVARTIDACTFLSRAEMAHSIGMSVSSGARRDAGQVQEDGFQGSYSSTCIWKGYDKTEESNDNVLGGNASYVILHMIASPAGSGTPSRFVQSFRDASQDGTIAATPASLGIGDEALWWGDGVAVRKGDVSFGLSVHIANHGASARAMAETLATTVAARL